MHTENMNVGSSSGCKVAKVTKLQIGVGCGPQANFDGRESNWTLGID
jgi:hypothetical protein